MTDGESFSPSYPSKDAKREVKVNQEEADPKFATRKPDRARDSREVKGGGVGAPSSPPLHPKKPAAQPINEVIEELDGLSEEVDELVAQDNPRWPPGRAENDTMGKYWAPSVTEPISKAEEEFPQYWRRNVCPICYYSRGHSDLRLFVKEMKRADDGTKPKSSEGISPNRAWCRLVHGCLQM